MSQATAQDRQKPRREPWDRFLLKALLVLTLILTAGAYVCDRYRLGIDDQLAKCLPPYRWYLIDTFDRRIERDRLVAFAATDAMAPYFRPGQTIIKRVAGVPGDRVSVATTGTSINGAAIAQSDPALATTLGRSPSDFVRERYVIPDEHLWVTGATRDSFDSRYWGPLPVGQVIGRAYALF
jgi:conjugal transfer pilin signal peptidase TrbI